MNQPPFDAAMAAVHIGKTVLIGETYLDAAGELIRREQFAGIIRRIHEMEGISVEMRDGSFAYYPPNIQSLKIAPKGDYTLKETGEVITDPDLLWSWTYRSEA